MSSSYRSLSEVRENLRIKWYRSAVERPVLRELTARSDLQGWLQTLGHFCLYLATGTLAFWLWSNQLWVGFAAAMILHGTVSSFLRGIAPHELAHGTVFRTRWLNKVFLYLFSLISWWNHFDYALSHTYHHRYTLHPEGDREVLLPLKPGLGVGLLAQLFTVNLFTRSGRTFSSGGLLSTVWKTTQSAFGVPSRSTVPSRDWVRALHADQPGEAKKSAWWSRVQLLFHGGVIAVSILSGYWVMALLISVAPFTATAAYYFVGLAQHCGLRDNDPDFRKCARSITLGPVLGFLYWRMNWHAEHHMYAAVPCYNLKRLALVIANDMPAPHSLVGAWREMRQTWQRQKNDPTYQFDMVLPQTATLPESPKPDTDREGSSGDELDEGMGDLAPKGLS